MTGFRRHWRGRISLEFDYNNADCDHLVAVDLDTFFAIGIHVIAERGPFYREKCSAQCSSSSRFAFETKVTFTVRKT